MTQLNYLACKVIIMMIKYRSNPLIRGIRLHSAWLIIPSAPGVILHDEKL